MTSEIVVDASVAVKWIFDEEFSDHANGLLPCPLQLIAPTLVVTEVANALWKKVRSDAIDAAVASEALKRIIGTYNRLHPDHALAPHALALSLQLDHPVYDCVYLALALQRSALVLTADRRLLNKLSNTPYAPALCLLSDWSPP